MNIYVVNYGPVVVGSWSDQESAKEFVLESVQKRTEILEHKWEECYYDPCCQELLYKSSQSKDWEKSNKFVTRTRLETESAP